MNIKLSGNKTENTARLIFNMLEILKEIDIPVDQTDRRLERMSMACLAVGGIISSFDEAKSAEDGHFLTTREIINFENTHYGENISPGSYDDIRRKDLLLPVQAGIILNSSAFDTQATNNPTRGYALSPLFAALLKQFNSYRWPEALVKIKSNIISLQSELEKKRELDKIPVILPSGTQLILSPGEHNILQKEIIQEFLPRFGFGSEVLYIGDTSNKTLFINDTGLKKVNFFTLEHDELPDIIAFSQEKNLLFLIEAVHSTGPMNEIRVRKLQNKLEQCTVDIVFVTAFMSKKDLRKWISDIAWDTEVWIADNPDHMIHFNGCKFLEIHK